MCGLEIIIENQNLCRKQAFPFRFYDWSAVINYDFGNMVSADSISRKTR